MEWKIENAIEELERLKENYYDEYLSTNQYENIMFALDMGVKALYLLDRPISMDSVSKLEVLALIVNVNYKYINDVQEGIGSKALNDLLNGLDEMQLVKPIEEVEASILRRK
jgi:hypothetical protein